ncbi:hypothetical protein N7495_001446 [Penicillium taxi]|uniref:uncharacterized protein n=1 Tax=Penicillium taxi TaxID=168475 RepID=UPI002545875E|nr:uncharacterized protein N7495_001446 [Penicillium taxi]KAJ5908764.1 hypothetical protein N7495_001446 [Penicillium taxi]
MVFSKSSRSAGSLLLLSLAAPAIASSYSLVETWQGKNFLDYFGFHTGADPTNGFVTYVNQSTAESSGLLKITDSGSVYIGVDHTTTLSPSGKGRDSVRIGTTKYYDHSLVIADLAHMPGSICGTWPAFWSVGESWPGDGEIDIIEGVNLQDHNEIVMHTSGTCALTDEGMTGAVNATGCGEDLGTVGCVVEGAEGSYGTSFNKQGGGVYAMEWTSSFVKIWFFPRSSIPASITAGAPDVTKFGTPMALVQDGCDVASSFKAQSFIFDVTFCGDWAGGVFAKSSCPMGSSSDPSQSCINYVAENPSAFEETYWEINSVKIYQTGVHASLSSTSSASTVSSTTQSIKSATASAVSTERSVASTTLESSSSASESTAAVTFKVSKTGARTVTDFVTDFTTICPETEAAHATQASAQSSVVQSVATTPVSGAYALGTSPVSTGRIVTDVVTDTTTICPETASASASIHYQFSPNVDSDSAWETPSVGSGADAYSSRVGVPSYPAVVAPSATPTAWGGASADYTKKPSQSPNVSPSTVTGLPTIIPAPGVVLGSANIPTFYPSATSASGNSAASVSFDSPSSTSSAVFNAVFTGVADKNSAKYSLLAAALGLALVA